MSKTTDFKELTKIYLDGVVDCLDCEDVAEESKKAEKALTALVPDKKLRGDIRDCFGMYIELTQRQGFIRGFQYATKLFQEAQGAEQATTVKDCKIIEQAAEDIQNRKLRFTDLSVRSDNARDISKKTDLILTDMFAEAYSDKPNVDNLKLRLDMMSDYLLELRKSLKGLYELSEIIYDKEVGEYVE